MAKRFVGGIAGLMIIVNISAGMHLHGVRKDDVQECQHHVLNADEVRQFLPIPMIIHSI